jgi:O-antigen ligase
MAVAQPRDDAAPARVAGPPWWIGVGIGVGALFLVAAQLETKWFLFLLASALGFTLSLAVPDRKAYYLTLLVLAVPIGVDLNLGFQRSSIYRSTHGFAIHLSHLPLFALVVIWLARSLAARRPLHLATTGLVPIAVLALACVASILGAPSPWFGLFELFGLATAVVLFLYTASQIRERSELRLVLSALMGVVALQGVIGLVQHFTGSTLGLEFFGSGKNLGMAAGLDTLTRVGGTLGHPNSLALFCDLLLPLGFSLLFCPMNGWVRWLLAAAVGLGASALVVSLSRGGGSATALAVVILALIHWSRVVGLTRAGLAIAVIITAGVAIVLGTPNPIRTRILEHDYGSAVGRVSHVQVAVRMIRDHPFFGHGMNNYVEAARAYDTTPEHIVSLWNAPVHNQFLFVAAETGLIGLAAMLALLLKIMWSLRSAIRSPDPLLACTGLGLLLGLVAFMVHAQVDYSHWPRFYTLWLVLGLAVSLGHMAPLTPPAQTAAR